MEDYSISKEVFAFPGQYKIGDGARKVEDTPRVEQPWKVAYKRTRFAVENAIEKINTSMFNKIVMDLKEYVIMIKESSLENYSNEISTAIVLTGVNLSDHNFLFNTLVSQLASVTESIAMIPSRYSGNMKNVTKETVFQLINGRNDGEKLDARKNRCNFRLLEAWHSENRERADPLVIIVPDFESFTARVLRDFTLVLSTYAKSLKFVHIFGVATTLHAVHKGLSYDVTSKLRAQVFHTKTQVECLSDVLENTALSGKIPFKLTGKTFQLLIDIFLFHDFSIDGFLRGYKICMLHHFYDNNYTSLCCEPENVRKSVESLSDEDLQQVKKLPSIFKYFAKKRRNTNEEKSEYTDEDFKKLLVRMLEHFNSSMNRFLTVLECLHSLIHGLSGAPLGKQDVTNVSMFNKTVMDLKEYVIMIKECSLENYSNEISTAIVLTGVNLSDHNFLFNTLVSQLASVTESIAMIPSRYFGNVKNVTEETVFQLINGRNHGEKLDARKNRCNFRLLEAWHSENRERADPLVTIVPDFESFTARVLRDFIIVLSRLQVFHTETQVECLSDVLENTALSGKILFKLTGKTFQLLIDIFLSHDFSIDGFLRGYKAWLKMSQQESRSPYKQAQLDFLKYLDRKVFAVYLKNPSRLVAKEIFCFSYVNAVRHAIKGSYRAAIHTGLTNPQVYLQGICFQCDCCILNDGETIRATMPDICFFYNLHLKYKRLINTDDWLQDFAAIVSPRPGGKEQRVIDP